MELKPIHELDFETYLNNLGLQQVTISKHLLYFKHFKEMFGGFITQKTLDSFLQQKTSPNHKAMIKHLIDLLKRDSLLTQEEQLEVNRFVILKRLGRKGGKPIEIFTKEELKRLLDNCKFGSSFNKERFKLMVLWQYSAGLRVDELCRLKWEHLNYQGRTKFFEQGRDKLKYQKILLPPELTKGEKGAYVYIMTEAYLGYFTFLDHWKGINESVVNRIYNNLRPIWVRNKNKYSKEFKQQCLTTLGLQGKTTHILRHSRATHLFQEGLTLLQVRDFMRHSSVVTTEKYLHLAQDMVSKGLEELDTISDKNAP